jgi:hypothetical protein
MSSSSLELLRKKLLWYMKNENYIIAHVWDKEGKKVINNMKASIK